MRQIVWVGTFLVVGTSIALAQQASADPAAWVAALQQESGKPAKTWLHSGDARTEAWGAAIAVQQRQTELVPDLLSLESAHQVRTEAASTAEKDQHDAMIGVLDALIQFNAEVPAEEAARLYPEFPAQAMILLARSKDDTDSLLLPIFRTEHQHVGAWLAAGNLLAQRRVPGFASAVLRGMTVHALVIVQSQGESGWGRGGSTCCGYATSPPAKSGWPAVGNYTLGCGQQRESTVLVPGAARRLRYAGLLTDSEPATPKLAIEIWDQRSDKTPPLPVVTGQGDQVTFQ